MDAVQHFEIPYKVRERAKKFYFQAFGWQILDVPGMPYSFATTVETDKAGMPKRAGAINGGLTPRTKVLTAPTMLIRVGDLKSHLERVRHAGGTVLSDPTAMGPVWYARFRDPEGNVLGAIQARPEGQETNNASRDAKAKVPKSAKAGRPSKSKAKPRAAKASKATAAAKPRKAPRRKPAKREPQATWSR